MSDGFTWGTVTSVGPLRVQLDGDTAPLPFAPDSLVDPLSLAVANRVRCELSGNRVLVHGRSGGAFARVRNPIDNGAFRTNQSQYASGGALGAGGYGHDRWRGAGVVNLDTNPRFEAASTGWSAFNGSAQAKSTAQAHSGTASMAMTRSGSGDDYVGKSYTVVAGRRYRFSCWARVTGTGASNSSRGLGAVLQGTVPNVPWPTTPNVWQRVTMAFVADTAAVNVRAYVMTGQTIYMDDVCMTEGDALWPSIDGSLGDCAWSGSADASTSTRGPATNSYSFTATAQGQIITLASGAGVMQILERADIGPGSRVLSWMGTAVGRVYNLGTETSALPAFGVSGSAWAMDGLDDVVIEFRAVGGAKTLGEVQFESGSAATPYERITVSEELARCQRHARYWRGGYTLAPGIQQGAAALVTTINTAPMRVPPGVRWANLWVTDNVAFNNTVTALYIYVSVLANSNDAHLLTVTHSGAAGTAYRPGSLAIQDGAANSFLALDANF